MCNTLDTPSLPYESDLASNDFGYFFKVHLDGADVFGH